MVKKRKLAERVASLGRDEARRKKRRATAGRGRRAEVADPAPKATRHKVLAGLVDRKVLAMEPDGRVRLGIYQMNELRRLGPPEPFGGALDGRICTCPKPALTADDTTTPCLRCGGRVERAAELLNDWHARHVVAVAGRLREHDGRALGADLGPADQRPVDSPLAPSAALLAKLGSIIVHTDEGCSATGHPYDWHTVQLLMDDLEVREWLARMSALAMLPVKR